MSHIGAEYEGSFTGSYTFTGQDQTGCPTARVTNFTFSISWAGREHWRYESVASDNITITYGVSYFTISGPLQGEFAETLYGLLGRRRGDDISIGISSKAVTDSIAKTISFSGWVWEISEDNPV